VLFCDGAEYGEADGVVATHTNTPYPRLEKRSNSVLDTKKSVLDGERIHGEIAEVGDAMFGEGIHMQDRIPRSDDRGLDTNIARPEARAGAISCAAIEGDADKGNP
jgi:hypothetical protein